MINSVLTVRQASESRLLPSPNILYNLWVEYYLRIVDRSKIQTFHGTKEQGSLTCHTKSSFNWKINWSDSSPTVYGRPGMLQYTFSVLRETTFICDIYTNNDYCDAEIQVEIAFQELWREIFPKKRWKPLRSQHNKCR